MIWVYIAIFSVTAFFMGRKIWNSYTPRELAGAADQQAASQVCIGGGMVCGLLACAAANFVFHVLGIVQ